MKNLLKKSSTLPSISPFLLTGMIVLTVLSGCSPVVDTPAPTEEQIGRRINTILELPTYEYVYRDVIYIADQASFLGIRHRDTQLLFSVDVRLHAGIDLRRGFTIKRGSAGTVHITLPDPEILRVDADEATIHQYFKKELGGGINRLDYYDEIADSKERIIEDALSRGILDQAERNAETLIRSVLTSVTSGEVRVSFSERSIPSPAGGTAE